MRVVYISSYKPKNLHMTLDHTIRQAYINTLLDGGHTRIADVSNPTEGYIVGGVTEPITMELHAKDSITQDGFKFPEHTEYVATNMAYVEVGKQYSEFKKLWCMLRVQLEDYTSNLYKAGMGVGTWIHKGKIYFDLVQHMCNLDVATTVAKERGEIAIYDCKNQKDILL
tara:strand:- start:771 stop:1277 length:507 start_codon:yes stop_codon:yes gene_type:complete